VPRLKSLTGCNDAASLGLAIREEAITTL
jgi:hypothetical protein